MSKSKQLSVRVGDTVQIGPSRHVPSLGQFRAKVMEIAENSCAQTIITYHRLDGVVESLPPLCNVSLVTKIIERAPYVIAPQPRVNIFVRWPNYTVTRQRGHWVGELDDLVHYALTKVRHIDLPRTLHRGRLYYYYDQQRCPGKVAELGRCHIKVRAKIFLRWVSANAGRLIKTKQEALHEKLAHKAQMDADLRQANIDDMDAMFEEDESDLEARFSPKALDDGLIDAGYP